MENINHFRIYKTNNSLQVSIYVYHLMMLLIKFDKHEMYKHIILYIIERQYFIYSRWWQKITRYRQIYLYMCEWDIFVVLKWTFIICAI
jgi:hypothetical protein